MRHPALSLSTLLVALTLGAPALAEPAFYNEVIKDLDAGGCPPSTYDYVTGCNNLCHVEDPYPQGAKLPNQGYRQPFCALLMTQFGWSDYATLQASTLDTPLAKLKADPAYAQVVATVQDGCSNPQTEIAAAADGGAGVSLGSSGPVYGCAVGPLGTATPYAAFAVWGVALAAMLAARRRRRSGRLTLALAGACGLDQPATTRPTARHRLFPTPGPT